MAECLDYHKKAFGPLTFSEETRNLYKEEFYHNIVSSCCLCDTSFLLPSQQNQLLKHIFDMHHLIIADVEYIGSLKSYLDYWRIRFSTNPITDFCRKLQKDVMPDGTESKEEYFLISDDLPEDSLLRESLQQKRLKWALDFQASEREDGCFSRVCIFCNYKYRGRRRGYISHLSGRHNLQLGNPENLVFIDRLLETIEQKLDRLQCIFCEKIFKDKTVLKEHMRKKFHKKINPGNRTYDKFYIINYLEIGKTWQDVQKEQDLPDPKFSHSFDDWSDWDEEYLKDNVVCLFCEQRDKRFNEILIHIKNDHEFDFKKFCKENHLKFYSQVKLVNFIRHKVFKKICVFCEKRFKLSLELLKHMGEDKHFKMPDEKVWNQPLYFFPTYENDAFLQNLEDEDDNDMLLENLDVDDTLCSNVNDLQVSDPVAECEPKTTSD